MNNKKLIIDILPNGRANLTLNRPDAGNALDAELIQQLIQALTELEQKEVRLLTIQSNGKHFSAGADLNWMKASRQLSHEENLNDTRQLAELLCRLNQFPAPTIARVQGAAYGGAVGLIAACDMAFASDNARFCLSEVKIGLIPAVISPYVINALGEKQSRRYFMTAEVFNAEAAKQLNLINEHYPENRLNVETDRLSKQILDNSPQALAATKRLIRDISHKPIDKQLIELTCQRIADIRVTDEAQEGLAAFLEKRIPGWRLE